MAQLRRIKITGYRSIKAVDLELRPLNVLIGSNGAGKSNFVSFFKLLNEMTAGRLQQYIGTSGHAQSALHFGPKVTPRLDARLEFGTPGRATDIYEFHLLHAAGDALLLGGEVLSSSAGSARGPIPTLASVTGDAPGYGESLLGKASTTDERIARKMQRLLGGCLVYHFHDTSTTARVRQSGYLHDNRRLAPDAANLAAMLYIYRERHAVAYRRIVAAVRKIVPEFDDFDLEPSRLNPNDMLLNWRKRGHDYLFGPHQLSDGSLRAMAICTLLLQPDDDLPEVIILDEPELGLHPHALELVAGLIRAASECTQVIAATQSQTFLNFFEPSEIVTVEARNGESVFRRLDTEELKDWLDDYTVGELWQRNVLGGGPLP